MRTIIIKIDEDGIDIDNKDQIDHYELVGILEHAKSMVIEAAADGPVLAHE